MNDTQVVMKSVAESAQSDNRVGVFRQHQYVRVYTDSEGGIRIDTTQKAPVQLAKNTEKQIDKIENKPQVFNTNLTNSSKPVNQVNSPKKDVNRPKEIFKDGFRQHAYIKIYKDKDGRIKFDTTSFEKHK